MCGGPHAVPRHDSTELQLWQGMQACVHSVGFQACSMSSNIEVKGLDDGEASEWGFMGSAPLPADLLVAHSIGQNCQLISASLPQ